RSACASRSSASAAPRPSGPAATRRPTCPGRRNYDRDVDLVTWETRGTTAILTIDRPERRNAVDTATAGELLAGLRRFEADDELLVMVLTGAGDQAFCAGADLKAVAAAGSVPGDVVVAVAGRPEGPMGFTRLTAAKPVIAAIGGW